MAIRPTTKPLAVRDLIVWSASNDSWFVSACDVNAGFGDLPDDVNPREPEVVGYSAAKVPLMEVLAARAEPIIIVNTLGIARDEYGLRVLDGIRQALREVGSTALLTGSDETNSRTRQTSVGVTVIGAGKGPVPLGSSRAGDLVVCIGIPKDGISVPYSEGDADIASLHDVVELLASPAQELLPVGSHGVEYEIAELARTAQVSYNLETSSSIDLRASAGASTCMIATVSAPRLDALGSFTGLPVAIVAELVEASAADLIGKVSTEVVVGSDLAR